MTSYPNAWQGAYQQGCQEREVHIAHRPVTSSRQSGERNGMSQIGAYHFQCGQAGVKEEQGNSAKCTCTYRRKCNHDPEHNANADSDCRLPAPKPSFIAFI